MIGNEEGEEVQFKVADRRKFNPDGSLREGVVIEPTPAPAAAPKSEPAAEKQAPEPAAAPPQADAPPAADERDPDENYGEDDDGEIPGADNPASFINFLSTLATNAAAALGAVPHPATGQRSVDLESGKYWLEIIAMLREKTKNNLHPQEARLLDGLLGDMRMQYVQLVRASEERLKAQAARRVLG